MFRPLHWAIFRSQYIKLRRLYSVNHKRTYVFMWSAWYYCPILPKFFVSQHIFLQVPIIKFKKNPSRGSRADMWSGGRRWHSLHALFATKMTHLKKKTKTDTHRLRPSYTAHALSSIQNSQTKDNSESDVALSFPSSGWAVIFAPTHYGLITNTAKAWFPSAPHYEIF